MCSGPRPGSAPRPSAPEPAGDRRAVWGDRGEKAVRVVGEELDVAVRSHRLHAQRFGSPSAPLVIGVHGLSGNMKNFDFVGERLGGDALQLVALDLPRSW